MGIDKKTQMKHEDVITKDLSPNSQALIVRENLIDRLIRFSVWNPAFIFVGIGLVVLVGVLAFRSVPVDAVPDITNVQVQVNTPVPALAPETIEMNITYPIETSMRSIPQVESVRSITRYGLSQVTVNFVEGADLFRARQLVAERLQTVGLPQGAQPELGPIATGLGEIFHYKIEAKQIARIPAERERQLMRLRTLQEWDIKPRLLDVEGVAEINTIGGHPEQYYVQPDMNLMATYGVHLDDLVNALKESNRNTGGGYVQQSAEQFIVKGDGVFRDMDAIRAVPVKVLPDFSTISVGDLARVDIDRTLRTGAAVEGGNEVVLGTVMMLQGENSRVVAKRTGEHLLSIAKTLPDWAHIEILYDRSDLVDATIKTVQKNLIYGALLVIVVLFFLTGNLRAALITAIVIPLSLLATLALMELGGFSANLMSLGALDFGIIIDGAVIVIDHCIHRLRERSLELDRNLSRHEVRDLVAAAAVQIRNAAGFGQLIIIIVFLPIFALTGIEGKMFRPMAIAFVFALLSAFIFSFSVVPGLAGLFLSGKKQAISTGLMARLEMLYGNILLKVMRWRFAVIMTALLTLISGSFIFFSMGSEFIPRLYEGSLAVQFIRPVTIGIDRSVEMEEISQKLLLEFSEIKTAFGRIGTAEIATDPMGVNTSDTIVMFKPASEWPAMPNGRVRTPAELKKAIAKKLRGEIPGQRILMSQPIQLRFNELMEGTRADISLKVFGDDLNILELETARIAELIGTLPGSGDVEAEMRGRSYVLNVKPDWVALRRHGTSSRELLDTIQIALGGEQVGYLYKGLRRFPLLVRLDDAHRRSLSTIRNLPIGVEENTTIPLQRLSKIEFTESFEAIKRESSRRRAAVLINPASRDTAGFVRQAKELIDSKIKLPQGYYMEWGGNYKNLARAGERLQILVPLALMIVAFMIYSAFRNSMQTLLVFCIVPFAIVGGVFNLAFFGLPFSISAAVGFIALSGIAVLNGIVLISFWNELHKLKIGGADLIVQGATLRLRAILMTALTDILGFLPMMMASGMGAEVQKPLATVVVGGLISATAATLILLPLFYKLSGQTEMQN